MSKRGLSDVVTTVLIILLVVVAVVAIGAYVVNLVGSSGRTVEREGVCLASTVKVDGCRWFKSLVLVQTNRTVVSITSSTDSTVTAVSQLSYLFTYADGSSETFTSVNSLPGIGKGSISQEFVNMTKQPSSVAVGGRYTLANGKLVSCPVFTPVSCLTEATSNPSYLTSSPSALNVAGSIGGSPTPASVANGPTPGAGSTGTSSGSGSTGGTAPPLSNVPIGGLCTSNNECTSKMCSSDLEGGKRCNSEDFCSIGEKKGMVFTGNFACASESQKRLCDKGVWTSFVSCQRRGRPTLCSNGICEEERNWFISPNTLSLKGGITYPIYFNLNNANRSISNILLNLSNGDTIHTYHSASNSLHGATFFFGGLSRDFVLGPSEGILIKRAANGTLILNGSALSSAPSVQLNSGFNLVGIGPCASSYYSAVKILEELNTYSPNCSVISQVNTDRGPIEYWSTNTSYSQDGLKKDFRIYEYESFFIRCNQNTSLLWRPSNCPIRPTPSIL